MILIIVACLSFQVESYVPSYTFAVAHLLISSSCSAFVCASTTAAFRLRTSASSSSCRSSATTILFSRPDFSVAVAFRVVVNTQKKKRKKTQKMVLFDCHFKTIKWRTNWRHRHTKKTQKKMGLLDLLYQDNKVKNQVATNKKQTHTQHDDSDRGGAWRNLESRNHSPPQNRTNKRGRITYTQVQFGGLSQVRVGPGHHSGSGSRGEISAWKMSKLVEQSPRNHQNNILLS